MKSASKYVVAQCALVTALGGLLASASAQAADLGGNCCADLEERIAELEATTARKGNRKVSLTISGWVNEAVVFWDDGRESNAYVGTNSLEQSRVKFTGDAKITDDWSAGYTLEVGVWGHSSSRWDQDDIKGDGTQETALTVRKSNWFVKSKTFGKFTMGLEGTATYHLLDDADGVNTRNYSDAEAAAVAQARFKLLSGGSNLNSLRWGDVLRGVNNSTPGQNGRRNIVRYDTPEFAGFVATASWGEDDMWGVALTYKGTVGDFKLVGKAGYEHNADEGTSACSSNADRGSIGLDCEWWGVAGTVMHAPTGLYVYAGYGEQRDNSEEDANFRADGTDQMWFIQAGIERKWHPLGATTIFGEYRHDDAGSNLSKSLGGGVTATNFIHDSSLNFWAAGVVQNIDAAAMDLYVIYRHADGDVTNFGGLNAKLDNFDMLITGARIQF